MSNRHKARYKLAIDMCYFSSVHAGGKDETAYNLLRGFEKNGVSREIVCLCPKEIEPVIRENAPHVNTRIVPQLSKKKFKIRGINKINRILRRCFGFYGRHCDSEVLLFPNKETPARRYKTPTIVIPHDIEVFETGNIPYVTYTKRAYEILTARIISDFKNRDCIIAISDFDKAEMIKFMPWAEKKIKRIYDPICFDKLGDFERRGTEYITVLNILHTHKNVETVIRAFATVADKIEQSLILVGKVPDDIERLKKLVVDLGVESRVRFTGFVSVDELQEIVRRTRLYINASSFEGFGMTAVEMMGRGIPTIVANNTSQKEVTGGLCYYYEPADDFVSLSNVILQELINPMSPEKLEEISQEMHRRYSYEIIAEEYWNLVLKIAEKSEVR